MNSETAQTPFPCEKPLLPTGTQCIRTAGYMNWEAAAAEMIPPL